MTTGQYLTDGWRLFRVIDGHPLMRGGSAELEDCLTHQRTRFSAEELRALDMQVVEPPPLDLAPV